MKKVLSVMLMILVLITGCSTNDKVTITAEPDLYSPLMSSVQGITLTPNFSSKTGDKSLIYHWETEEGEFIGNGKEVYNQGEAVLWSAVDDDGVAEIENEFKIKLEVTESESSNVLASAEITIAADGNGFYSIKD